MGAITTQVNDSNSKSVTFKRAILEDQNFGVAIRQSVPRGVDPDRIKRSIWNAVQQQPKLLDCSLSSLLKAGTTAAVLGLEVDNALGQGYIVPYKDTATFVPGYKGYITLAQMSGYIVTSKVVRQNDQFEYYDTMEGPYLRHVPGKGTINERGQITHAYAIARSKNFPAVCHVMDRVELDKIRNASPAVKYQKKDSPWFTNVDAMYAKCPIRALASKLPLNVQRAATIEDSYERGEPKNITPTGDIVDAKPEDMKDVGPQRDVNFSHDQPEILPDTDPFGFDAETVSQ